MHGSIRETVDDDGTILVSVDIAYQDLPLSACSADSFAVKTLLGTPARTDWPDCDFRQWSLIRPGIDQPESIPRHNHLPNGLIGPISCIDQLPWSMNDQTRTG
jgi:hypothetical protein